MIVLKFKAKSPDVILATETQFDYIYEMRITLLFLLTFFSVASKGQSNYIIPHSDIDYLLNRQTILSDKDIFLFPNVWPYDAYRATEAAIIMENAENRSRLQEIYDLHNMQLKNPRFIALQLYKDSIVKKDNVDFQEVINVGSEVEERYRLNNEPFLKYFYRYPAHFFQYNHPDFSFQINPILNVVVGKEGTNTIIYNQRGISLSGQIDQKVYFYSNILESQARFPIYLKEYENTYQTLVGNGFYKPFQSSVLDEFQGYDYLNAQAGVGCSITKHISAQFAYSKHFIGNGVRSLFLSDFSDNYLNLSFRTTLGRFFYQNIYGEIFSSTRQKGRGDKLLPKKYFAAHYLGFKFNADFQIGLFESVVFSRNNNFEFHYLMPIILYRTIEGAIGSPDNVLLGGDIRYDIWNSLRIYSQVAIDEFKLTELGLDKEQWWANKYAFQLGFQYVNVANIKNMDLQVEYNLIRPFMYSHRDSSANFVHGNNPLTHPKGSNLSEVIVKLTYRPLPRFFFQSYYMFTKQGISSKNNYIGEDPRVSSTERSKNYGYPLLIGDLEQTHLLHFFGSYRLWSCASIFFQVQHRWVELLQTKSRNTYVNLGFSWNFETNNQIFLF